MDDADGNPTSVAAPSLGGTDAPCTDRDKDRPVGSECDGTRGDNMDRNAGSAPSRDGRDEEGRCVDDAMDVSQERRDGDTDTDPAVSTGELPETSALPERDVLPVDDRVLDKLTAGFLQTFLPQAESSSTILDELMRNQRVLIETLEQENAKFQENVMLTEVTELMTEAKRYHSKLVHLRKEMVSLHEKSTKLKKRALKLQNNKMKQNLQKEQQRERELEQEKHLIAKPATRKTP